MPCGVRAWLEQHDQHDRHDQLHGLPPTNDAADAGSVLRTIERAYCAPQRAAYTITYHPADIRAHPALVCFRCSLLLDQP
jgi:hypothetical protein